MRFDDKESGGDPLRAAEEEYSLEQEKQTSPSKKRSRTQTMPAEEATRTLDCNRAAQRRRTDPDMSYLDRLFGPAPTAEGWQAPNPRRPSTPVRPYNGIEARHDVAEEEPSSILDKTTDRDLFDNSAHLQLTPSSTIPSIVITKAPELTFAEREQIANNKPPCQFRYNPRRSQRRNKVKRNECFCPNCRQYKFSTPSEQLKCDNMLFPPQTSVKRTFRDLDTLEQGEHWTWRLREVLGLSVSTIETMKERNSGFWLKVQEIGDKRFQKKLRKLEKNRSRNRNGNSNPPAAESNQTLRWEEASVL
jgi:hypothetical protein